MVNAHHMLLILEAEELSGTNKEFDVVRRAFDDAIAVAGKLGFMNNHALVNERAGVYCLEQNDQDRARSYLSRAQELYMEWGAPAKARQMSKCYATQLGNQDAQSSDRQHGADLRSKARLGNIDDGVNQNLLAET